ncbi:hypothetical protein I6N95_17735 [Vagococcus sp. BWB3-3]|uniref:Uncharacterized protein n=1 Tax=Vagococcus allomyrinae TaxID=2794353 RepID=A0A940PG00_9ENTE|nr:hypothetical protein [Vagococcus allomyrinae]MBP1042861.1 hypothetical protein [Vagococcus allomyrinae]
MPNRLEGYSVYDAFVKFENNPQEGKNRPVAIVRINLEDYSTQGFGIYSYKYKFESKFKTSFYQKFLYKIKDVEEAGLNPKLISYVDVSKVAQFSLIEMMKETKYRGRLSKRDAHGLIDKYKSYKSLN